MNKKIISKKLEGNNVVTIYEETAPRYSIHKKEADFDMELEDMRNFCSFFLAGKFSHINNTELEKTGDFEKDAATFLDYCKEKNLTPFVANVYDHSGCSFSFAPFPKDTKNYNTRHGWDSYCCGFVGIDKETTVAPETLAGLLTDIWNGDIEYLAVFDKLEMEEIDIYTLFGHDTQEKYNKTKKEIKDLYGLDID